MNNLQIFNFEGHDIRTFDLNGNPWFAAADVCAVLEVANNRDAVSRLDDDEKDVVSTDTLGGKQKITIVSEAGLYTLILGSRKQEAKRFKRWVTHIVIPSIRKHGGYVIGQEKENLSKEEFMAKALLMANSILEEKEKLIQQKQERIDEMRPKEIFADAVTTSTSSILVRDLAKLLRQNGVDTGEKRLFKWLRDNGYICKNSTMPTQRAMNMELFEILERSIIRADDKPLVKQTTKVTGKGQQFFVNKFLRGGD